ncbi:MAG TPA: ABC transporter permease [Steroidobacteraceae bacterium]|jgi:putative ABC transport system permease protein|nr:ABC transporter permease [Steroidobacteraceae bacterium]
MWRHYLSMAARGLARHRLYSLINIVGLAVGLTCIIFVVLFIRDQLSYDKWIPGTANVYRLELTIDVPDRGPLPLADIPYPMPAAMREQIPGVTGMTRYFIRGVTLTSGDRQYTQQVAVVDPGFFQLIRLPLIKGARGSLLRQPDSIVLSQSAARQYFGGADPIGRTLTAANGNCDGTGTTCPQVSLRVTGVVRDLPYNTQLTGEAFISTASLANPISQDEREHWFDQSGYGYVRLAPGVRPGAVAAAMATVFDQDVTPELSRIAGMHLLGSHVYKAHLTPFTRVHLDSSQWKFNMTTPGSWSTLYGVAIIGVLTLFAACFNFMNLTTARATLRAREIALRRLLGAGRGQLILQFLGEAVLIALVSLIAALALAEILLPLFDGFLQRPIALHYLSDWSLLLLLGGVAVATGLISGSYPALVLSRVRPIAGLRGGDGGSPRSGGVRNVLVLLQFAVSVGLGIAAGVVFSQVNYARSMSLGFDRDNVVVIGGSGALVGEKQAAFVRALRADPGIAAVGLSNLVPFGSGQSVSTIQIPGQPGVFTINTTVIGPQYPEVYGIRLLAGRLLSTDRGADRLNSMAVGGGGDPLNEGRNVLINAAAARHLGFTPQEAVDKIVLYNHNHVRIVGVLADARLQGALQAVAPMFYVYVPSSSMSVSVRLRPGEIPATLGFIDRTWHVFMPTEAIQRWFLDGSFDQLYRQDDREGRMLALFVIVAVLIGCLGLYGLAIFTAERRTKEIGIRKVSGARTRDIVGLMLWRISVPVLISNLIAWPFAYAYLRHWLDTYAYHIPLTPFYFLAAAAVALLIAWVTVYGNTLRLARTSPVHALRYE